MDDDDNIIVTEDDDEVTDPNLDDEDLDGDDEEELDDEPTLTFKVENGRIRGKVDELPVVEVARWSGMGGGR